MKNFYNFMKMCGNKSYTQDPSVDNEASIFSIGGTWANIFISLDSDALVPDSASCLKEFLKLKIYTHL